MYCFFCSLCKLCIVYFFFMRCEMGECSIQLAVNVQIPAEYGGLGGKAVYIGMCIQNMLSPLNILLLLSSECSDFDF